MRKVVGMSHKIRSRRLAAVLMVIACLSSCFIFLPHSGASNPTAGPAGTPARPGGGGRQDEGQNKHRCKDCARPGNQSIYVPLIELPEARGGELVFNSRSTKEVAVTPVFYKRDGSTVVGAPVNVRSGEISYADVRSLLPAARRGERDWGGMSLTYYGGNREIWSQFRFMGVNGGGSVDEFFTVKDEPRSDVQEAVWWMPEHAYSIIALGNVTDLATRAAVTFGDGRTEQVELPPHATEVVRGVEDEDGGVESVRVDITGAPGSIIPTGVVTTRDGSFNSVIRFYDTRNAKQPHLFANGLRLAGVAAHMVLKNTSAAPVSAQPRVIPSGGTDDVPVTLPEVSLGPNEATEVDLSTLYQAASVRSDLDVASVEVTNSGAPGSLLGAIYGVGRGAAAASYDVPLRDSGPVRSMTGAYPWKIGADVRTVAYVTNITDREAEFASQINYAGGKFVLGLRKLRPGETATFDFQKMRDGRAKDNQGNSLPANVNIGQFVWSLRGVAGGKVVLIGRAEMVGRAQLVSTSYSCAMDCGLNYDVWADPLYVTGTSVGTVWELGTSTAEYTVGPYAVTADWSVDEPVATFSDYGGGSILATGVAPGAANFTAYVGQATRWAFDGSNCLDYGIYDLVTSGSMAVLGVTNVTATGATKVTNVTGDASMIHFVTPKGGSSDNVTLTATISPDSSGDRARIDWEGATEDSSDPLQATVSKSSAARNIVKIKVDGHVVKEFRVWVVWATISSGDRATTYTEPVGTAFGTGAVISGGYDFTHTIQPSTIVTDANRPNLSGANTVAPPGGNHWTGNPLSGGADKKWDNSRQMRTKWILPTGLSPSDFSSPALPDGITYPTNDVEGNDDSSTGEETNDPYGGSHVLTGTDAPNLPVAHSKGAENDEIELRLQFREFTRLEIQGTWQRISDFYLWRIHFKLKKTSGKWVNNGTSRALNNDGF